MAIKGRHKYMAYLDANYVEKIKDFLDEVNYPGGWSGFINNYCCEFAEKLENADSDEMLGLIEYYGSEE